MSKRITYFKSLTIALGAVALLGVFFCSILVGMVAILSQWPDRFYVAGACGIVIVFEEATIIYALQRLAWR